MCTGLEVALIAGTAVSAGGAIYSGIQQANAAEAQQDMLDAQAAQQRADAQAAKEQAEVNADKIRKAADKQRSKVRAQMAASGVNVGAGSAVTIADQVRREGEEDALTEILSGQRTGRRLEQGAINSTTQGSLVAAEGRAARTAGFISAGGTLLSAGAKGYDGWKRAADAPYTGLNYTARDVTGDTYWE